MADFAGTKAILNWKAPFAGHPGHILFTSTLTAASYVAGNLNLATAAAALPGSITPESIKDIKFSISSTIPYMVTFTPNASPTWANLGTLKLWKVAGTATSAIPALTDTAAMTGDTKTVGDALNALKTALGGAAATVLASTAAAEASGTLTFTLYGFAVLDNQKPF